MRYYEKSIRKIERSMKTYPRNILVMDSRTFRIVAQHKNLKTVGRKRKIATMPAIPVIFQQPDAKTVWILTCTCTL